MATETVRISVTKNNNRRSRRRQEVQAAWAKGGLAVTPSVEGGGWTITHVASGYSVKRLIRLKRSAITLANRLLDAGDWTRSRTEVTGDRSLKARTHQIVLEAKALGLVD